MTQGVALADAFNTLQIYLGSLYVNDFNLFGRTWQVIVQADAKFRNQRRGGQAAQGAQLRRHDGAHGLARRRPRDQRAADASPATTCTPPPPIHGAAGPGISSRQAIDLMEQLADENCCPAMHTEWTELAYLEIQAGNTAMIFSGLAVVVVFLVLAAQYESWSMPLAVILVVPMCLLSAIIGVRTMPRLTSSAAIARRPGANPRPTSISSRRSASSCSWDWRARTRS